jgi:hypothetical protein
MNGSSILLVVVRAWLKATPFFLLNKPLHEARYKIHVETTRAPRYFMGKPLSCQLVSSIRLLYYPPSFNNLLTFWA